MQPQQQQQVNVAAAPTMVKGIKADWHVEKYRIKQSKCMFDAGFDIYPDSTEPKMEDLGSSILLLVGTSVHFCFPIGSFGYLCERSSSNAKIGGARIRPGVFDAGYTGECLITIIFDPLHLDGVMAAVRKAQTEQLAIAQMIIMPVYMPVFSVWNDKNVPPGRGSNGFGHSDIFIKS